MIATPVAANFGHRRWGDMKQSFIRKIYINGTWQ